LPTEASTEIVVLTWVASSKAGNWLLEAMVYEFGKTIGCYALYVYSRMRGACKWLQGHPTCNPVHSYFGVLNRSSLARVIKEKQTQEDLT